MSQTEAATPTAPQPPGEFQEGRDAHGRYAPGNKGGPGNPYARQVAALRKEVVAFLAEGGNLRRLLAALLDRAEKGDNAAAKMLMAYGLGREAQPVHPDDLEAHEAAVFRAATAIEGDGTPVTGYPSGMWNQFVARMRPIVAEAHHRQLQADWAALCKEHDQRLAAQQEHDRQHPPAPVEVAPPSLEELRQGMGLPAQAPGAGPDKSRQGAQGVPAAVSKRSLTVLNGDGHHGGEPPECR
jgi:hypothetical protein